ncbi:MAG TPA: S8 family serine peptidase, partial [Actinoplanes sp.]|nr:S8 family serine peptidase [Actinoplanes sp.]
GVQGIAPEAKILPVRDSTSARGGNSITVGNAIKWAVDNSATVVNVSSTTGPSLEMQEALTSAKARDVVIVAGVGNTSSSAEIELPAAAPGVLAVGSIDRSRKHSAFSIMGEQVQICAPGVDILTTRMGGGYAYSHGTSPATAIVSGAAALVRAKFPDLSAPEVIHRLTATADDVGPPGRDDECGFGVLNIVKALTADVPPLAGASPSVSAGAPPSGSAGSDAQPERDDSSAAVIGGIGAVVLLIGGIIAFLLVRRRKERSVQD